MTALSVSLHRDADALVAESSSSVPLSPFSADDVRLPWQVQAWQRPPYRAFPSDVATRLNRGPAPPPEWAPTLHQVADLARTPVVLPTWWTPATAFCGGIETWTGSDRNLVNRQEAQGGRGIYLQLSLAGWGHFQLPGEAPKLVTAGKAVLATNPSGHCCYLPEASPGWTFVWLGIDHPYLKDRLAKQIAATGSVLDLPPNGELTASILRLVRGAIKKDFRDRFEAEIALFEFVPTFERWAQQSAESIVDGQSLMDEVRSRILAGLPKAIGVHALAAEFGMSRSHFSHYFRGRTGLTPAHFSTEVRVEKAASMLRETHDPLKAIADACGFASANHLCKVFRRLRHLSPSSLRQECR